MFRLRGAPGIWWVEVRGAAKHPQCGGQPTTKIVWSEMSVELMLRNPPLDDIT